MLLQIKIYGVSHSSNFTKELSTVWTLWTYLVIVSEFDLVTQECRISRFSCPGPH